MNEKLRACPFCSREERLYGKIKNEERRTCIEYHS